MSIFNFTREVRHQMIRAGENLETRRSFLLLCGGATISGIFSIISSRWIEVDIAKTVAECYISKNGLPASVKLAVVAYIKSEKKRGLFGYENPLEKLQAYKKSKNDLSDQQLKKLSEKLDEKISQDYVDGRVLNCNGWWVSKTEAELCALTNA